MGAFGAFASVDDFVAAGNNGLLSEALANAQAGHVRVVGFVGFGINRFI